MNSCVMFSALTLLTTIVVVLFLIGVVIGVLDEMGYYTIKNDDISTPINLRGFHASVLAYERFEKIHNRVLMIAATGGHDHKFNLCFKDPEITNTIDAMVREAFPDSTIKSLKNGTCTAYKMSW